MAAPHAQGGSTGQAAKAGASRDEAPLRVILVGRTGLDAKLRLDPAVELVRVKTALDAVGELSNPIDPDAQGQAVVIVAPDADPAGPEHADAARAKEFTAALRKVDRGVRVLRLEEGDGTAPSRGGYDGIISPDVSADVLRTAVRGTFRHPPKEQARAVATPPAPAAAPTPAPSVTQAPRIDEVGSLIDAMLTGPRTPVAVSESGDETLVRLLLQGRDLLDAAVEILRGRLAGRDVVFVSPNPNRAIDGSAEGVHEASVGWRGRLLGRLRSRTVPAEQLAPHAAWLASWLALREQHAQLREAAFTDSLTGAHNRRFFDHFLQVAIDHAASRRQSLTVLMFDIDDFKQFNDRYGHGAGDEILRETVRLLRSVIRPTDRVCRIGGDEFVVIFHEPDGPRTNSSKPPSSISLIARRFQDAIASHKFPKLGRDAPGALAISGGLATYPWDGRTAAELLGRADELALQSKRAGKNCITLGPGAERECGIEPGPDEPV